MQEKTEKPSHKKLQKARKQGEVVYSAELTAAIVLITALFLIWLLTPFLEKKFFQLFEKTFNGMNAREPLEGLADALKIFLWPTIILLGSLFFMNIISHIVQKGWVWKRSQGKETPFILTTLIKVILIGIIGYFTIKNPSSHLFVSLFFLVLKVAIGLLVLGFADLFYQKWRFYRKMQMTKQEAKEEQKEEGGQGNKKGTKSNDRQK